MQKLTYHEARREELIRGDDDDSNNIREMINTSRRLCLKNKRNKAAQRSTLHYNKML